MASEAMKLLKDDAARTPRERLAHYMAATGLSARQIASALSLPHETPIAQFLAGKESPEIERGLRRLFAVEPGEEEWQALPFDNLISVWELARMAARRRRMVAVEGRSGYGKTSALRLYARLVGAIHYEYDEVSSCRDALRKMCKLVGVSHVYHGHSIAQLRDKLLAQLVELQVPLIVDQFDTAPFKLIEAVRGMWDEARVPIIIAGLAGRLMPRLERRNARENCEQILRRITAHITLPPPSAGDLDLLCERFHIQSVRGREFLRPRGVIGGYGVLRTLCEDAEEIARANGAKSITLECLQHAQKYVYCAATSGQPKGELNETAT